MKFTTLFTCAVLSFSALAQMPEWSYDPGPDPSTKMGKELIDLTAGIPDFPMISTKVIGRKQKFRPAFGPIPWRMLPQENKVKILFVGQDGTHIAEAAGRPATAGFGGRAQDLANYFGVNEGAAFINSYAFTIKGQYGIYNTPYIYTNKQGKSSVRMSNLVDNKLWMISQNLKSPIVQWRNDLIDWIIRNNKESMKLIVLFGGTARDSIATFARSKGAVVGSRMDDSAAQIQVPETKEEYAGGNNTFPSLVSQSGRDLYSEMVGRKLVYKNSKDQKEATESLKNNLEEYLKKMVFTKGGPYNNGLLNMAQLGGYDLDKMIVNGVKTRSLKGLVLNDGTKIENDIIVISLPHPSSLSRTVMEADSYAEGTAAASARVMRDVKKLKKYADNGWYIEPDLNKTNYYARGESYRYGRSDIGPEFYDFGTPANRMVSRSTARRMSKNANVVIIGTRDNGKFSMSAIKQMTEAKAAYGIDQNQLFIARPSNEKERYVFDAGPGTAMAKLMITNLDEKKIFQEKSKVECINVEGNVIMTVETIYPREVVCGDEEEKSVTEMTFAKNGIDAYNVKTHPSVSDFGHYRGTFDNPKVLVLADPIGYDDIVTARALTGTRGQYIQGLMDDIKVADNYLVLKTVPFGMDGATSREWETVLEQTNTYREKVLKAVLAAGTPDFILADGKYAQSEAVRILADAGIPIVMMNRTAGNFKAGLSEALTQIKKIKGYKRAKADFKMANIPRSHLSFYSRVWEGTSGDRVITSDGIKYKGIAFAEVVPRWAYTQKLELNDKSSRGVEDMIQILRENNLPLPYESIPEFIRRTDLEPGFALMQKLLSLWAV